MNPKGNTFFSVYICKLDNIWTFSKSYIHTLLALVGEEILCCVSLLLEYPLADISEGNLRGNLPLRG